MEFLTWGKELLFIVKRFLFRIYSHPKFAIEFGLMPSEHHALINFSNILYGCLDVYFLFECSLLMSVYRMIRGKWECLILEKEWLFIVKTKDILFCNYALPKFVTECAFMSYEHYVSINFMSLMVH